MGFLKRAVSRGISNAVGRAIGQALEPTVNNLANKAARTIDSSVDNTSRRVNESSNQLFHSSGIENAVSSFEKSVYGIANEAAKNMKICPNCEKAVASDKKFCPECGAGLPEKTLAQSCVCEKCGTQNDIGTKFCQNCGEKLLIAIMEEEKKLKNQEAVMCTWDELLSNYPKWNCGGTDFSIESEEGYVWFSANFENNAYAASNAVEQYRQVLMQNGFVMAGQYPSKEHLYKKVGSTVYHVDTEHCFEGDSDCPQIYFNISEPYGGFDYVKPEPQKKVSFKDLLGL